MTMLTPASPEEIDVLRRLAAEISGRCLVELMTPIFSPTLRRTLKRQLTRTNCSISPEEAVDLIQSMCWAGQYHDVAYHAGRRKRVVHLLHKSGYAYGKGKHTLPHLAEMVEGLAPLLLALGVPDASGENSRMVAILRDVAAELWGPEIHDPRDELRRLIRKERAIRRAQQGAVLGLLAELFEGHLRPPPAGSGPVT
jgi:hypothetical protein